ncbi:DNA-binding transcriptional MerR regulator [Scopulibacillus darangshiensis]|uniref:DNA-binding transcriptional MerR regulator n=1 Tax=Scopulibacillus darangshiensis TaxID=442528 RepID=A0A4R2NRL6_9BACL|nr:MerR family transcriptional regulator [Scopulibacillus darangshiensis]TCP24457.1 DNA-binding transcriptional MerR regulator [Scopulibacillus darangshiensis]
MCDHENPPFQKVSENQGDLSLTVKEAAIHINESPHVVRNWMKELKGQIPTIQKENGYHYFDVAALERLLLIQKLSREQNYTLKQIHYYLSTGEDPLEPENISDDKNEILEELKSIKEMLKHQENFNKALVERLENQNKYMEETIEKREQQLLLSLKETKEENQPEPQPPTKKGFFARLFNKDS